MTDEYELVSTASVTKSMIRKIGENQYLKIIPSERKIEISTIEQPKITEPIVQTDETIVKGYPKEVKLFKNQNQDAKYETRWESQDGQTFDIPLSDVKTIYTLLEAKNIVEGDNMLNISNILGMVIKQNTLEQKIESIKEEI